MKINIQHITPQQTYTLREKILRKNSTKPFVFDGDFEKTTIHLGAYYDNTIIGVVSLMKKNQQAFSFYKQYQLRGMAIATSFQQKGVGQQLICAVFATLKNSGVEIIWCNARVVAVTFYEKLGFIKTTTKFNIPSIGLHYLMYKEIIK